MYTELDAATLSAALHDFPLSDLGPACRNRVDALHDLTQSTSMQKDVAWSVQTDKATFLVLAYACCVNHAQWFVRNEARHLMTKVDALTAPEKAALLGLLLVDVQPMQAALHELELLVRVSKQRKLDSAERLRATRLQSLVKGFGEVLRVPLTEVTIAQWQAYHAVDFEDATRLVASRQVALHGGTAYVQDWQLTVLIRQTSEARLTAFVQQCKLRLAEIGKTNTEHYAPQFSTVLSIMHDVQFRVCPVVPQEFRGLDCSAQTLPMVIAQFAPLCIVKLVLKLRVQKHLVDRERVTLRLWLRNAKVGLDVAVEFWQQHVPPTEDARGPIAHVFAKQYACVGCTKIRAQGLCPFQDSSKSIMSWCAESMPSAATDIEDIVSGTQCPSERCAKVFALRHGDGMRCGPRNPANYFSRAVDAGLR